jgi:hypothetical protein
MMVTDVVTACHVMIIFADVTTTPPSFAEHPAEQFWHASSTDSAQWRHEEILESKCISRLVLAWPCMTTHLVTMAGLVS